jgi:transposase
MARTQEYTAKEVADALREADGVVRVAANRLGCNASTVYRYANRYVTVERAMHEARKNTYAEAQGYLLAMMRDRDHKNHKWAVEQVLRHYGEVIDDGLDWTEKERREHSSDGFSITIVPPDADD